MGRFVDASDGAWDMKVGTSHLGGHQVDVVVAGNGEQQIGFAHARLALNVDIDSIPLDQFNAFILGSAAETPGFFIDDSDLVATFDQRGNCSRSDSAVSDDDDSH